MCRALQSAQDLDSKSCEALKDTTDRGLQFFKLKHKSHYLNKLSSSRKLNAKLSICNFVNK